MCVCMCVCVCVHARVCVSVRERESVRKRETFLLLYHCEFNGISRNLDCMYFYIGESIFM